jgi:hypothetical protein
MSNSRILSAYLHGSVLTEQTASSGSTMTGGEEITHAHSCSSFLTARAVFSSHVLHPLAVLKWPGSKQFAR